MLGHNTLKFFDRDSNLKMCLIPGLAAQKVENHCSIKRLIILSVKKLRQFEDIRLEASF